ncbi:MAG TPA: HAMP domain-containing sensor histidine kinase [Polyangiaceae bacterium]|jgi:two-component system sensor histidine kinase KdpD
MAVRFSIRPGDGSSKNEESAIRSDVWSLPRSIHPEPTPAAFALHDAKNMMGVLSANLEVLSRKLVGVHLPSGAADALEDIGESARRLGVLLRDALAVAQGYHPQAAASAPLCVAPIVTSVVHQMRPAARGRGVRIVCSGGDEVMATVDPVVFERVVVNLLENAVRFSPARSTVEVEWVARGERMILAIGDRGPGVSDETRDALFESYRHRDPGGQGSHFGLGLAYCRQIARSHGGDAWVFNRSGGGACFVFEIS